MVRLDVRWSKCADNKRPFRIWTEPFRRRGTTGQTAHSFPIRWERNPTTKIQLFRVIDQLMCECKPHEMQNAVRGGLQQSQFWVAVAGALLPLGQKKELLLPVKARRPDYAVTGNGITSVCFVTVGVKVTLCA